MPYTCLCRLRWSVHGRPKRLNGTRVIFAERLPKNANFGDPTAKTCRNSKEDRSLYDKQSALVKKLIYDREKQVEQSVINKAKLGSFYRFVNRKLSCKSGIGLLKADSGKLVVDDTEKAEMLNNYFTGVSTVDDGILPHFARRVDDMTFIVL